VKFSRPFVLLSLLGVFYISLVTSLPSLVGQSAASQAPANQPAVPTSDKPAFDVASVKVNKSASPIAIRNNLGQPGGYVTITNAPLRILIADAYLFVAPDINFRISGGPRWIDSEHFDIEATAEGNPTLEQKKLMLQSLLTERFKLMMHHEPRSLPVYALVLAKAGKTGPQLIPPADDTKCFDPFGLAAPAARAPCDVLFAFNQPDGSFAVKGDLTMEKFAGQLTGLVGRLVVDRTELGGTFHVTLSYTPQEGQPGFRRGQGGEGSASDSSGAPSIFTALQEQLGLKLESQTGPVDVLVIDHVEEPTPN
jgi:uncharacterized protein (TIGR03435 family)